MSRLATTFVLGYHGCDQSVAKRALDGRIELIQSDEDYDWLGPGVYFWESDPQRALEFAKEKHASGQCENPAVIGAVIDLRNCFDLTTRGDITFLGDVYTAFEKVMKEASLPLPENKKAKHGPHSHNDRVVRFLDCAVIRHAHQVVDNTITPDGQKMPPFDTVRGLFVEGEPAYPGAGFNRKTHIQIAVRNTSCILGLFWPRPLPSL